MMLLFCFASFIMNSNKHMLSQNNMLHKVPHSVPLILVYYAVQGALQRQKSVTLREYLSSGLPTRSNTNGAVHPRGLKFWINEVEGLYYVAKIKALISCRVTVPICAFVFAYAKFRFSHDSAQINFG